MADANVADICTRLYDIHKTESRITAARYFPTNPGRLRLPVVWALPSAAQRSNQGTGIRRVQRNFLIQCWVGDFLEGIATETAERNAEDLIPVIENLYDFNRRRLEMNHQPLDIVVSAELAGDTGIIDRFGKAVVVFTLDVEYLKLKG